MGGHLVRIDDHVIGKSSFDIAGVEQGIRLPHGRHQTGLIFFTDLGTTPQRVERRPCVRSGYPVRLQGGLHLETLDHLVRMAVEVTRHIELGLGHHQAQLFLELRDRRAGRPNGQLRMRGSGSLRGGNRLPLNRS